MNFSVAMWLVLLLGMTTCSTTRRDLAASEFINVATSDRYLFLVVQDETAVITDPTVK